MSIRFLLALVIGLVSCDRTVAQQVDAQYLSDLFAAHKANIESIQTGDVLIKLTINGTGNSPRGKPGPETVRLVSKTSGFIRFTFDFENQRFIVVNKRETESSQFDSSDNQIGATRRNSDNTSGVFDFEAKVALRRSNRGSRENVSNFVKNGDSFLVTLNVPQLFAFGGTSDGANQWQTFATVFESMDQVGHADLIKSIEHIGKDRYRGQSSMEIAASAAGGFRTDIDWDVKRQVPLRYRHYPGPRPDPAIPGTLKVHASNDVEWTQIEGCYVPIHGRGSSYTPLQLEGVLADFWGDQETELQFHWFSVNQQIPAESFDPEILENSEKLAELVDGKWFEEREK